MEEVQRSLGRLEAGLKSVADGNEVHRLDDERNFGDLRHSLEDIRGRMSEIERMGDSIEGHGAAIADLEARMSSSEKREELRAARWEQDRKWVKAIFGLILALAGDHFTGQKLSAWIGALLK